MRLVTVEYRDDARAGLRHGMLRDDQSFIDLAAADGSLGPDMLGLIRLGPEGIDRARAVLNDVERDEGRARSAGILVDGSEVRLRAPLPRPNSLRDFLLVEGHIRNARKADPPEEWYKLPIYYKGNVDAVIGPDDVVAWPRYTERLDFEIEVCALIGQPTRGVLAEDAESSIMGYVLFNDWSARDIQRREQSVGLGPGLGKDFANSIGPWILTADEFDVEGAQLRAVIDGETWSDGTLNGMRFTFPEIIEWLSIADHSAR
jgi:2-keto-4-pentenoate hydratase/2-oxohepta-3-ene-1,7-dioic acid hydratase in catechol pathway